MVVLIGMIACNKSNPPQPQTVNIVTYDTIKPSSYFPAYPGSYWVYDNDDTLKVEKYEKYVFNSAGYTALPDFDTLILPKLILNGIYNQNDVFAYVNGYSLSKSNNSDYRDPSFKYFLSLTEGSEFAIGGAFQGHQIKGKTIKVDTSIYIGTTHYENVIMVIQFDYACIVGIGGTPEGCATLREYYAKDVGLIKRETRNQLDGEFVKDIELVKYVINK